MNYMITPIRLSLLVDDRMNVIRKDNGEVMDDVWAIGDAAVFQKERLPATAQGMYGSGLPF